MLQLWYKMLQLYDNVLQDVQPTRLGMRPRGGLANRPCVRCRVASRPACRSRRSSSTSRPRRCYLDAFLTDTKHLVKGVPQTRCSGIRLPRGGSHEFLFKPFFCRMGCNTSRSNTRYPVHGYARLHSSIHIYIYTDIPIYLYMCINIDKYIHKYIYENT